MGEENVGKILSAPTKDGSYMVYSNTDYSNIYVDSVFFYNLKTATCKFTIYHNTDYTNKGRSSLFRRKKTCRLNVVNFDTLN